MKTSINFTQYGLNYPEIIQISDEPETGYIRLIGYVSDSPFFRLGKWYLFAETIYINPVTSKIHRTEDTTSKNKEWVISNDYKVILTENGVPVLNPDFVTEKEMEVQIGTDPETGDPIYETQMVPVEITLENSPFKLVNAFDLYFAIRHSRESSLSMPELFAASVMGDDMWGYFDKKETHFTLLETIITIYTQLTPPAKSKKK